MNEIQKKKKNRPVQRVSENVNVITQMSKNRINNFESIMEMRRTNGKN